MNEAAITVTPRWMLSFADLLSCILAFFVLLFSVSVPDEVKHNEYKKPIEAAYAVKKTTVVTNVQLARTDEDLSTNYLYDVMKEKIGAYPELKTVVLTPSPTELSMVVDVATFKKSAPQMAAVLHAIPNRVEIYSADLDVSGKALEILNRFDLNKKIIYFEDRNLEHKIDIVVYP